MNVEYLNQARIVLVSVCGVVGGTLSSLFGGWDFILQTLIIFMIADYITGLIVAGVFNKSTKTENGALESRAGYKGLCRKGTALLFVLIATRLDTILDTSFIRDTLIIGYIVNELISIVENAGLMGVPMPEVLGQAIEVLKNKADK